MIQDDVQLDLQAEGSPRDRILEGALRVFSERGFHAATVREITDLVAMNIASVNYYYGSKQTLIREVLYRYVKPIVDARLDALDKLQESSRRPTTRQVVETLVYPMVRLSRDRWGGRSVVLLLLQTRAFPTPEMQKIVEELLDPIGHRFADAFLQASPKLSREQAYWRYSFALGAIMQTLTDSNPATKRLERLSKGLCVSEDAMIGAQLADFITGGFAGDNRAAAAVAGHKEKASEAMRALAVDPL